MSDLHSYDLEIGPVFSDLLPSNLPGRPIDLTPVVHHQLKILPTLVLRDRLAHLVILAQLAQGHRKDLAELRPVIIEIGVRG